MTAHRDRKSWMCCQQEDTQLGSSRQSPLSVSSHATSYKIQKGKEAPCWQMNLAHVTPAGKDERQQRLRNSKAQMMCWECVCRHVQLHVQFVCGGVWFFFPMNCINPSIDSEKPVLFPPFPAGLLLFICGSADADQQEPVTLIQTHTHTHTQHFL